MLNFVIYIYIYWYIDIIRCLMNINKVRDNEKYIKQYLFKYVYRDYGGIENFQIDGVIFRMLRNGVCFWRGQESISGEGGL